MSIVTRHARNKPEPDSLEEEGGGEGEDTFLVSGWVGGTPKMKKKEKTGSITVNVMELIEINLSQTLKRTERVMYRDQYYHHHHLSSSYHLSHYHHQ